MQVNQKRYGHRFLTVLLVLVLGMQTLPVSGAMGEAVTLRIVDIGRMSDWRIPVGFQEQPPTYQMEEIDTGWDDIGNKLTESWLYSHPDDWDIARINTDDCSLAALCEAGLLLDLRQVESLAGEFDAMYPKVLEALSYEGGIYGIPISIYGSASQLTRGQAEAWEQLGFSEADRPRTFAEVCDLAVRYAAIPNMDRKGTVFNYNESQVHTELLFYFIDLYSAKFSDENGNISYDTELFRKGIADALTATNALKVDPKLRPLKDGGFFEMISVASSTIFSPDHTYFHVQMEDESIIPAKLSMVVVNRNTAHLSEVLHFAKAYQQEDAPYFAKSLKVLDDETLLALFHQSYDEDIAAQIYQKEDQSVIDRLEAKRALEDVESMYPRAMLDHYAQNIAPYLTFPKRPYADLNSLLPKVSAGKASVEDLIQTLQAAADAQRRP